MPNEVIKNINYRRSVRTFTDQPVQEEDIKTILNAANKAPSAHNQQSWKFIVIKGKKKEQLVELVSQKAAMFPRATSVLLRLASRSIACAPVVIAIANTGELIEHGTRLFQIEKERSYDFFRTMEIQSSAAAVENLLLAVTSLGLGAVWLGILFVVKDEVLTLLEEPKGEFMAVIPVGYPSKSSLGPNKKHLDMVIKELN
ncbi:MAG: nitroreductase family protein [bacterium]|nr:nitroreductase family protein [bacterium]